MCNSYQNNIAENDRGAICGKIQLRHTESRPITVQEAIWLRMTPSFSDVVNDLCAFDSVVLHYLAASLIIKNRKSG